MKKIIMISGLMLACITQANCQMKGLCPRTALLNPHITYTRTMNINIPIDPYNRFTSREDLKRLKENLEKIMFYNLKGYTYVDYVDKMNVKCSINNILSQQVNGLINLNNFISGCFPKNIKWVRLSALNKCILDTFDRKLDIYIEAYNTLAQLGVNLSSYPHPAITKFGNILPIPHYNF